MQRFISDYFYINIRYKFIRTLSDHILQTEKRQNRRMQPDNNKKNDKQSNENSQGSSLLSSKIRIKYFSCGKGKDHEGEVLNYVCVKKDCDKRGLLCSMCKADHQEHTTIPLKLLLSKLYKHKQKPLQSSEGFQNQLSQLEQIHKTMLYDLRVCVQSLADKFREIQCQINEQFSKAKIQLLQRVQINMRFNSFIQQAINNKIQNRQAFVQDMARISGMIQAKEIGKQSKQKQIQIKFSANFQLVVKILKSLQISMSENLKNIQNYVSGLVFLKYDDIRNQSQKQQNIKQKEKKKEKDNQKKLIQINKGIYFFSNDYRTDSILLQNKNKVAKQTKSGQGRFVFTNLQILNPHQKIIFKIKCLKNWIGLGVGIREKLKFLNFRFQYNNLGHGSYLVSSNGYTWSHSQQSNNISVVNFKFKEGDIVQMQYQKTKLIYSNKTTNDKHELKLGFNQAEQKDIFFCANLCSEGDTVQIIDAYP